MNSEEIDIEDSTHSELWNIGRRYDCLKVKDRYEHTWHYCDEIYPRLFESIREEVTSLLEIGVHSGGSLSMWRDYFPNAEIHGVDISFKMFGRRFKEGKINYVLSEERINLHRADQSRKKDLKRIRKLGEFDIIIDDGSHVFKHQKLSFEMLWPSLKKGGYYIIEDLHHAYESARSKKSADIIPWLKEKIGGNFIRKGKFYNSIQFWKGLVVIQKRY